MCVNETFPPRPRAKWLLITIRLSIINFAGIARTDVAVGTVNDASIACTTRALTPRIGSRDEAPGVIKTGAGFTTGSAGVGCADVDSRTMGCETGATGAAGAACATGAATGAGVTGAATGATGAGAGAAAFCCALGIGGTPLAALRAIPTDL